MNTTQPILRRVCVGLIAAALGLSLAGCGTNTDPGSNEGTDTIKIGVNYEQSGAVATYGSDSVDGIMMAVDEVNAAGGINGKQVEIVKYDTKSDTAEATTLATKLMVQDKVVAILGPATSGSFMATIPVANQNKVPVVSGSATADKVTVSDSGVQEYAFRTCFNDSFQGTAMANYASKTLDAKSAIIIKDNSSDYAKGLAENFTATFTAHGGTIVGEEAYVAGDTDFNAILTRARGLEFDVVYLPGYYQEAGLIIKAARELGINQPILGPDGFDSPDLLNLGGADALNNVFFTNHYSSLDEDPKVIEFIAAFQAKYSKEPNAFNALGYDTANFVFDAVSRATEANGEAIKDALASTKNFPAVTGTLSVDENHNPIKAIVVIGLENGIQASSEKISS
ncbi:MAG: ABC transporter substrate-binding protein [Propionibacteriaceae bacterium]|jgi:branched-chain amino acid transport system substrate-binding protein|nr:ABC transporter substrate-binding protein [Propionibacteriaceae bacterium]